MISVLYIIFGNNKINVVKRNIKSSQPIIIFFSKATEFNSTFQNYKYQIIDVITSRTFQSLQDIKYIFIYIYITKFHNYNNYKNDIIAFVMFICLIVLKISHLQIFIIFPKRNLSRFTTIRILDFTKLQRLHKVDTYKQPNR